jgi:hypothetical protein
MRSSSCTIYLALALCSLAIASGAGGESVLDKAKSAANAAGAKVQSAAKSVAYAAKSITSAALHGLPRFPVGVKTTDLYTPALEKQCPGIGARPNGCSIPLYDKITKQFKRTGGLQRP